jgi:hypothetical protein
VTTEPTGTLAKSRVDVRWIAGKAASGLIRCSASQTCSPVHSAGRLRSRRVARSPITYVQSQGYQNTPSPGVARVQVSRR